MALLNGRIVIEGLPPHRGILVSLTFVEVASADTPPPQGQALIDADAGCETIVDRLGGDAESSDQPTFEHRFQLERSGGFYYLDVGVVLHRLRGADVFAQVEHFFFARKPVEVRRFGEQPLTLPVRWPYTKLEALPAYEIAEAAES
jgi:hypothetical protein